ncbi:hypothetical protein Pmani_008804 [Petrolisthes manimaculis]|uniref:Uncharacterized protein n=1 Tax=Petrolisthes manimaculis TaxID=1843537 RepID=A0AAE1Q5J2_9EUCA|nr:hypothetical protein Pmani_008804 [Petrolisthes manimaculis]
MPTLPSSPGVTLGLGGEERTAEGATLVKLGGDVSDSPQHLALAVTSSDAAILGMGVGLGMGIFRGDGGMALEEDGATGGERMEGRGRDFTTMMSTPTMLRREELGIVRRSLDEVTRQQCEEGNGTV